MDPAVGLVSETGSGADGRREKRRHFMNCSNEGDTKDNISMEEYLRKRKAIRREEAGSGEWRPFDLAAALSIVELLYV